jgi:gas vesicle protein
MNNSKALLGFLAGAAVGAIAGILFAPDKGSNTRRKIATKTSDLADSVKSSFSDFIDGVRETYSGVKHDAEEFADKTKAKLGNLKQETKNAIS